MKIENIHEAKAFYIFLNMEKLRHERDIEQIKTDINYLLSDWDLHVYVSSEP